MDVKGYYIDDLVTSMKHPRKIFLMIKSGNPVDETIEKLTSFLEKGDLIIDGGNSYFKDTIRRNEKLSRRGILIYWYRNFWWEEGALRWLENIDLK
ncbi:MAG: NAD(P)-binding domain-containing protein [Actinobacteria bacterium]|nr:NAD(P)-binding domain-containing protein [Actinomycetota bacterium]